MNDDFKAIEKRMVRSFYEDGLTEIAMGAIFILLGGYFFGQDALPEGTFFHSLLSVSFVLVIIFSGLLVNKILRYLKRRITYPRAGFVSFRKEKSPRRKRIAAVSAALIGASISALLGISPSFRAALPAFNGILLGVALLLMAAKTGVVRFHVLAVVSAAVGVALAVAGIGDIRGISLYYALFGAAVTLSGLIALVLFLRRNRLAGEPSDEL
jgi:MFS family permease